MSTKVFSTCALPVQVFTLSPSTALSFLALHREVSAKVLLFLHGLCSCWLCGPVCLAARSRGLSGAVTVRVLHFLRSGQLVTLHRGRRHGPWALALHKFRLHGIWAALLDARRTCDM